MKPLLKIPIVALALLALPLRAGEMVVRSFSSAAPDGDRVLEHVQEKAVIAEYLDPMDTGIGKSIATLLWRETLTAISDQAGAGVILARAPEGERLVELLETEYHDAAVRIAEFQEARMALWGAALEQSDKIFLNTHLSLISSSRSQFIDFKIKDFVNDRRSEGSLQLVLPRTKFNFSTIVTSRDELFKRVVMTRGETAIYGAPDRSSGVVRQVAADTPLSSIDLRGDWFRILLDDGSTGWVQGNRVDVPPARVRIDRSGINLRSSPTTVGDTVVANADVKGIFPVLQQRYTSRSGLWYQIPLGGRPVWIASFLTEPLFSVPSIHFVGGLYRYYAGRYRDAVREFQRFIDHPGVEQENVNLSTAYQYQALAMLLDGSSTQRAEATLQKAIMQTPYDSTIYQIQALTYIGEPGMTVKLNTSLEQALEFDPRQNDTGSFVNTIRNGYLHDQ